MNIFCVVFQSKFYQTKCSLKLIAFCMTDIYSSNMLVFCPQVMEDMLEDEEEEDDKDDKVIIPRYTWVPEVIRM